MSMIAISANDADSGESLYPQVTLDGVPKGTAPQSVSTPPGRHTIGFGQVPGYICLTPALSCDVPANGTGGAGGMYRRA
ncbi:MAG: hypothetical protein ACD_45C00142G0009 [uncultured bacterium]|nr:MAG: hypothetical protein ACD_45C00142G0009 [uncultured bacterium]